MFEKMVENKKLAMDKIIASTVPVRVIMTNGFQLEASIVAHDEHTLIAVQSGKTMLIYKHAISTIVIDG